MSLAGIAIAIGVLVDAGIVVTENAFRHLEGVDTNDRGLVFETVMKATKLVGRPTFFSMAIIILAFVPVFALTGQEGKLFHPLAFAKTFAMVSATAIALTLVPILCILLLRGKFHSEDQNPIMRFLQRLYRPALSWALDHRAITLGIAVVFLGGAVVLASGIGNEFMPPLNEGDIMFMPIADASISLAQNIDYAKAPGQVLESFPEVAYVAAKIGARGDFNRSGRAEHDGDHRASQATRSMATRHDAFRSSRARWTAPSRCPVLPTSGRSRSSTERHADNGHPVRRLASSSLAPI